MDHNAVRLDYNVGDVFDFKTALTLRIHGPLQITRYFFSFVTVKRILVLSALPLSNASFQYAVNRQPFSTGSSVH